MKNRFGTTGAGLLLCVVCACGGGGDGTGPGPAGPSTTPPVQGTVDARFSHFDQPHVLLKNAFARPDQADEYIPMKRRLGSLPLLVILLDFPDSPHDASHDASYFESLLFGPHPSLRGYFEEVSYGRFTFANAGIRGWHTAPGASGRYFSGGNQGPDYGRLAADAVDAAAAGGFSFRGLDRDGNGEVGPDELAVLVVLADHPPANIPYMLATRHGQQDASGVVTGEGVEVDTFAMRVEEHFGQGRREDFVSFYAHELSHSALGLPDLYTDTIGLDPSNGFCLMTVSGGVVPHINPWAKIHLGWLDPLVPDRSATHTLPAVESTARAYVLHDPAHGTEEYFLIENRWPDAWRYETLASRLPDQGLALWHIDESRFREPFDQTLGRKVVGMRWPAGDQAFRNPVRALWDGADPPSSYPWTDDSSPRNARWADGSRSGIALRSFSPAGATVTVDVALPGR